MEDMSKWKEVKKVTEKLLVKIKRLKRWLRCRHCWQEQILEEGINFLPSGDWNVYEPLQLDGKRILACPKCKEIRIEF